MFLLFYKIKIIFPDLTFSCLLVFVFHLLLNLPDLKISYKAILSDFQISALQSLKSPTHSSEDEVKFECDWVQKDAKLLLKKKNLESTIIYRLFAY